MAAEITTTSKRSKASYSSEDIANALAVVKSNGGNILRSAKELNIPYHTLREWHTNGRRNTPEVETLQHEKELSLAQKLKTLAHMAVDHASDPEVLAEASALDAAKIAGIAVDKNLLLTGQPTSINEERTIDSRQVLVLMQDWIGQPDPLDTARDITPATAGESAPAAQLEPATARETEGRFARILRERRETTPAQT